MPALGIGATVKRRLLGLTLVVVIVGLIALTGALYSHAFRNWAPVALKTQDIGNQLIVPADVKLRGVLVGEVTSVSSSGRIATLHMEIDPSKLHEIPANVVARILPKTLFGEKYVDLVYPDHPETVRLAAGDVIPEDRSKTAIELQNVFQQLVPLLKTLKPVQLNQTLSALADALRGRGEELGKNLSLADDYFRKLNAHLPTIQHDISGLADLASSLDEAAPSILAQARNFAVNARTLTDKQDTYADFLRQTATFADTATQVFGENADRIISLAHVSRPVTDVLAYYSPEFTCLLNGLATLEPRLNQAFGPGPYLHITLEYVPDRGAYTYPADLPKYDTITGPDCHGLPSSPQSSAYPSAYTQQPAANSTRTTQADYDIGPVGSTAEQQFVTALLAPVMNMPSDDVPAGLATLLAGPMMRGMAVGLS